MIFENDLIETFIFEQNMNIMNVSLLGDESIIFLQHNT